MEQISIFQHAFGTPARKLARADAPDTSQAAASLVNTGLLERMVYHCIAKFGRQGCISDELREMLPHLPYSSVTARPRTLLDKGLIEDTGERRIGASGRSQRVLRIKQDYFGRPE